MVVILMDGFNPYALVVNDPLGLQAKHFDISLISVAISLSFRLHQVHLFVKLRLLPLGFTFEFFLFNLRLLALFFHLELGYSFSISMSGCFRSSLPANVCVRFCCFSRESFRYF